ncbi:MAG: acylphosphatase [Phycisphaerales bacterium JB063]
MTHTRIIYTGKVQGVGFRWTCERLARDFPVAGYVQNQADGSVLLECEGEVDHVTAFLSAIDDAMGANINGRDATQQQATGAFGNPTTPGCFRIKR